MIQFFLSFFLVHYRFVFILGVMKSSRPNHNGIRFFMEELRKLEKLFNVYEENSFTD